MTSSKDLGPATLDISAATGRYGVAFLRSICAQAHVGCMETSPGEDMIGIDAYVEFPELLVGVQVKTTSQRKIHGKTATYSVKKEWIRKWNRSRLDVYFLLVIVPPTVEAWIDHAADGTFHRTAAFWRRIQLAETDKSISVPKDQRFGVDALATWHTDAIARFSGRGDQS